MNHHAAVLCEIVLETDWWLKYVSRRTVVLIFWPMYKWTPLASTRLLAQTFRTSRTVIEKILKNYKYHSYEVQLVLGLTSEERRLNYVAEISVMDKILWSDETALTALLTVTTGRFKISGRKKLIFRKLGTSTCYQ